MVKTYQETVQDRLIQFLQSKVGSEHGWKKKACELLEMETQNLSPILRGERLPGNTLQYRLYKKGCSIDWLMFGESITTSFGKE